jgi:uncharacterized protein YrrD
MIRGRELIGIPVFSLDQGKEIGEVKNLVFDPVQRKVTDLILKEGGLFRSPEIIPFEAIEHIGPDAAVLKRSLGESIAPSEIDKKELKESFNLTGRKVLSEEGHDLGTIYDIDINERTGEVYGFELTQGLFRDSSSGKKYIEYDHIQTIGEDAVIVDAEATLKVMSQKGGLAKTFESIKEAGSDSLEKARGGLQSIKETSVESLEKAREKSESLGLRAREKSDLIAGRLFEKKELWGSSSQESMAEMKLKSREQMERTKRHASRFWENLSNELERGYQETKSYFERLRERVENHRVEQALGRRISRTILDPSDEVILRQGDIITHQAVVRAREIGALDSILNSVVKENRLYLRQKETQSAGEEIFSQRPPLPGRGERLQKAG